MKGIVFTEFMGLINDRYGLEVVQRIIDECDLDTEGAYTAVGTYSHKEFFKLLNKISEIEDIPVDEVLEDYGEYFFKTLSTSYPHFMDKEDLFDFLMSIDNYIHPNVLKLYPKAELPKFDVEESTDETLMLRYNSTRKMAHFGMGLITGASHYFGQKVKINKEAVSKNGEIVLLKISKV